MRSFLVYASQKADVELEAREALFWAMKHSQKAVRACVTFREAIKLKLGRDFLTKKFHRRNDSVSLCQSSEFRHKRQCTSKPHSVAVAVAVHAHSQAITHTNKQARHNVMRI